MYVGLDINAAPEAAMDDARLVAALRPRLIRLAWGLVGDLDVAEDLTHDALASVLDVANPIEDPAAYARTALVNRVRSRWRRLGRERAAIRRLHGHRSNPVELPEASAEVWTAIQSLPMRQRVAVVLVVLDDLPLAAVAEHLECSVETARTHLRRGKHRLTSLLQHLGDDQS